jgi:hypothetical protein
MSMRTTIVAALDAWASRYEGDIAPGTPEQMADAYRAEVLHESAEVAVRAARSSGDDERGQYVASVLAGVAKELRRMAGKDTREGESTQPAPDLHSRVHAAITSTRGPLLPLPANTVRLLTNHVTDAIAPLVPYRSVWDAELPPGGLVCSICGEPVESEPCTDHAPAAAPFVPRTEREYWVDIADALNAANAAGMPVGIDMEGILTDHQAWAVVWNRETERWEVGGYEDDSPAESPADAEDWVICCSPSPRCPNGERRARAVERGWTQNGRAGNWLCATHSPSDFFRPDRTYTRSSSYGRTASFRVTHVSTPPGGGERMAFGWKHLGEYDTWTDYSSDDFAAWTEVGGVR